MLVNRMKLLGMGAKKELIAISVERITVPRRICVYGWSFPIICDPNGMNSEWIITWVGKIIWVRDIGTPK